MEGLGSTRKCDLLLLCFGITLLLLLAPADGTPFRKVINVDIKDENQSSSPAVTLRMEEENKQVFMENGLVGLTISVPDGNVLSIAYKGIDNVLSSHNKPDARGYLDVVWNQPQQESHFELIKSTKFSIITQNDSQVEVSFSKTWDYGSDSVPLNVDKRYILRRGSSGFYMYSIFERLEGFPALNIASLRNVFKLQPDRFDYMAVSDDRQTVMPTLQDRLMRSKPLGFSEAVLLIDPSNPQLRGRVDDKYQYSCENQYNRVHGWISTNSGPSSVGFCMITPSNEFRNGGPIKQDLTSHAGPTTINVYVSGHYAGKELSLEFDDGEPWKIVYGPSFVYLNSGSTSDDRASVWADAKTQWSKEAASWPYDFIESKDFLSSNERGSVSGQLLIHESFVVGEQRGASDAYVGLARPGDVGSWQTESKGYQFWTRANKTGGFVLKYLIPGDYSLYAWVPGVIGDYKYEKGITIIPGTQTDLGPLTYKPPRNGPTLWEIGIPDRTAAEFYVPDPYPEFINNFYRKDSPDKFRQYGLWERYSDMYPNNDLVYTVGVSDYRNDWFYAQVTRHVGYSTYEPTTWNIVFDHQKTNPLGSNYTLQIALASATYANVQVRFNNPIGWPHFSTGTIGWDNAIARQGIHGLYWLFSFEVPDSLISDGKNTIHLRQAKGLNPYQGVMYDYIRLEGPPSA